MEATRPHETPRTETRKKRLNVNSGKIVNEKKPYVNVNTGFVFTNKGKEWAKEYIAMVLHRMEREKYFKQQNEEHRKKLLANKQKLDELYTFQKPLQNLVEENRRIRKAHVEDDEERTRKELLENAENSEALNKLNQSSNEYRNKLREMRKKRSNRVSNASQRQHNRTMASIQRAIEREKAREKANEHFLTHVLPTVMENIKSHEERRAKNKTRKV